MEASEMVEVLSSLTGLLVRGKYKTVVGGSKPAANVVIREGVEKDEIKGFVDTVRETKTGNVIVVMRNMNRITAGDRAEITEADLIAAELDHRVYKGLPGEYAFRSYRAEGLHSLEVYAGRWRNAAEYAAEKKSFSGSARGFLTSAAREA